MITITAESLALTELDVDVIAVGVFKGGIEGPGTTEVLALLGLDDFPVTPEFRGDVGQTLRLAAPNLPFRSVVLVGLGRMDGISPSSLRRAAGEVMRAVPKATRIATTLAEIHPTRAAIEAVADGLQLGAYTFDAYRTEETPASVERQAVLVVPSSILPEAQAAIERSTVISDAVTFARDLVNTPGGDGRPLQIAQQITERLAATDVEVIAHDREWLVDQGFGAMLGVARGSEAPPVLLELRYEPPSSLAHVVVVGKGITFDSGGLNIKSGGAMMTMKSDMAGAAAVAGAVEAIASLGARVQVTGLLALVENAIGGDAQRPSDIVTAHNGLTIEIGHTDAEGRLALADTLAYAAGLEPDAIIDLATLTGSAVRALGPYTAALFGDDETMVAGVITAAEQAGEPVWRLPLPDDMDARLDSSLADLDHLGPDDGPDAIMAALFLRRFTGGLPWAHLDMAGPAMLSEADARGHQPVGATGYGVTTLVNYLQHEAV